MKNTAIVLAGGSGSRMKSEIPKQYLKIEDRTVLYYSLKQFQDCPLIDDIILVAGRDYMEFCRDRYIKEHNISKIKCIAEGGSERYESVMKGLEETEEGYVFIHDGARPCITGELITRICDDVKKYGAVITAVPSKDTVKIADEGGCVSSTPDRNRVWMVQTPQAFKTGLIKKAYDGLKKSGSYINITDDAMLVEMFTDTKVHITKGEYTNIKITTPEDMGLAEMFIKKLQKN